MGIVFDFMTSSEADEDAQRRLGLLKTVDVDRGWVRHIWQTAEDEDIVVDAKLCRAVVSQALESCRLWCDRTERMVPKLEACDFFALDRRLCQSQEEFCCVKQKFQLFLVDDAGSVANCQAWLHNRAEYFLTRLSHSSAPADRINTAEMSEDMPLIDSP